MSPKSYRPIFASHSSISFSKGSLSLYVIKILIGTSVCDNKHSLTIVTQVVGMAQREKSCVIDLRVTSSDPTEQLPIFFHNVFQFLQHLKVFVRRPHCCFLRLRLLGFCHPSYGLLRKTKASKSSINGLPSLQKYQMLEIM